jgi:hypothetical protein
MKQINVDSTKPFELHYFHLHVFDKLSYGHQNFHHPNLTWAPPCCFALVAHYLGRLLNSNSTQLSHNYLYKYIFSNYMFTLGLNFYGKNHQFFNITKFEKKTLSKAHLL